MKKNFIVTAAYGGLLAAFIEHVKDEAKIKHDNFLPNYGGDIDPKKAALSYSVSRRGEKVSGFEEITPENMQLWAAGDMPFFSLPSEWGAASDYAKAWAEEMQAPKLPDFMEAQQLAWHLRNGAKTSYNRDQGVINEAVRRWNIYKDTLKGAEFLLALLAPDKILNRSLLLDAVDALLCILTGKETEAKPDPVKAEGERIAKRRQMPKVLTNLNAYIMRFANEAPLDFRVSNEEMLAEIIHRYNRYEKAFEIIYSFYQGADVRQEAEGFLKTENK